MRIKPPNIDVIQNDIGNPLEGEFVKFYQNCKKRITAKRLIEVFVNNYHENEMDTPSLRAIIEYEEEQLLRFLKNKEKGYEN